MSSKDDTKEEQEKQGERKNVVSLSLIQGGKVDEDDSNWLGSLPQGTHFLCKVKGPRKGPADVVLSRFVVVHKYNTSTLLFDTVGGQGHFVVENVPFSTSHRRVEIIGFEDLSNPEREVVLETTNDGNSDTEEPRKNGDSDRPDSA